MLSTLKTPVIATVIGEGGSGGALAIGLADKVFMLENSMYSVISPEGCASILWKTNEQAERASEALGLTADKLFKLGLIDQVILEGEGAHLTPELTLKALHTALTAELDGLRTLPLDQLIEARYQRLMKFGSHTPALPVAE
jgi:acetyl-CoA carboxylase carboxyl transferase subunit alpha